MNRRPDRSQTAAPSSGPLPSAVLAALLLLAAPAGANEPLRYAQAAPTAPGPEAALPVPAQKYPPQGTAPAAGQAGLLPDFTALVERQGPAVVNLVVSRKPANGPEGLLGGGDPALEEFLRRFFPDGLPGPGPADPVQGLGSGFIISQDGFILTNAHVVADAEEVIVRMSDSKREFKGKVVGVDSRTDVALVKVDATGLPTVKLGSAKGVKPGQWVAAIGSPFGFTNSITSGIVSATGRNLPDETLVPFIQTDVAVNPGNSGGPLLNMQGEVIGVNSMIYSRTGGYMGVSFAIPIEVALDVAKQLQTQGKVTRGRLGVGIQPVTRELAQAFGLEKPIGVLVSQVEPGSAADKAKLQSGDVILSYNGRPIQDSAELPRWVASTRPGTEAKLEVWRNGNRRTVNVIVGELVPEKAEGPQTGAAAQPRANSLGLVLKEIPPEMLKQFGVTHGLLVEGVQAPAARTLIRPGDVILRLNQTEITSLAEFNKLLAKAKPGESVALLVKRGEATTYVTLKVGAPPKK